MRKHKQENYPVDEDGNSMDSPDKNEVDDWESSVDSMVLQATEFMNFLKTERIAELSEKIQKDLHGQFPSEFHKYLDLEETIGYLLHYIESTLLLLIDPPTQIIINDIIKEKEDQFLKAKIFYGAMNGKWKSDESNFNEFFYAELNGCIERVTKYQEKSKKKGSHIKFEVLDFLKLIRSAHDVILKKAKSIPPDAYCLISGTKITKAESIKLVEVIFKETEKPPAIFYLTMGDSDASDMKDLNANMISTLINYIHQKTIIASRINNFIEKKAESSQKTMTTLKEALAEDTQTLETIIKNFYSIRTLFRFMVSTEKLNL